MELRCSCGTLSHSLPRGVFEKTPLGTPKNFFKCVKAKPDCLSVFRAGTSSRLKGRTPLTGLPSPFVGRCPTPCQGCVFEKTPLGTLKNFFRFVKAKPDGLLVFRAGTLSRLKRLGLFRSCRREASSKTQGLSEDASRHAREHKTPTEGTAPESIDRFPEINGSGIPGSLPFHEKYVAIRKKVFGSTPFSKGVAGCRAGNSAKSRDNRGKASPDD